MKLIDNRKITLRDDLIEQLKSGSRLSIAASCFSMYAFQELKEQLSEIEELRFIFTSPTFTMERTPKPFIVSIEKEFYVRFFDDHYFVDGILNKNFAYGTYPTEKERQYIVSQFKEDILNKLQ